MELLLLKLVAFLRPILLIEVGQENLFDLAAILTFGLLAFTFFTKAAVQKSIDLTLMDVLVAAFALWSVCVYAVYFEMASMRNLAKLIIPFFTYTIARNVLTSTAEYLKVLLLMIIGFVPPVLLSAGLIASGGGLEQFGNNYWTGIPRWAGVFAGSHNLGHSMTFLLMAIGIYLVVLKDRYGKTPLPLVMKILFVTLAAAALYCLWMSQVRTALVGLVAFMAVFLFFTNRKALIVSVAVVGVVIVAFLPLLFPYLFPDLVMIQKGQGDMSYIASGRPVFWENNLKLFAGLSFDRQLAGVGIGNKEGEAVYTGEGFMDSHNDFLEVLIHTGIVGFVLFLAMQIVFFRAILRLNGAVKYGFLAFFLAIAIMNFSSNSYISRFGLGQMYYIVLAYVGLRAHAPSRQAREVERASVVGIQPMNVRGT
jgi:O-antigen ligase